MQKSTATHILSKKMPKIMTIQYQYMYDVILLIAAHLDIWHGRASIKFGWH